MNLEPFKNCIAFKKAIHITNNTSTPYGPCCWYGSHVSADSWEEYQEKISQQDVEKNCKHCIDQEAAGITSHRSNFVDEDELVIGVFFDNVCNLKCVSCGPSNSSQWLKDYATINPQEDIKHWARLQKYTPDKVDFIKSILADVTFKKLRLEIYGGEPLIGVAILEFLDWLYEQPYANCTYICFATNGTTYLPKLEKYMDKFGYNLGFSIDGIGQEFEYLRTNAVFDEVQAVIDRYRGKFDGRVGLNFNYTMSWMNSLHFADFYNWVTTRYPEMNVGLTVLKGPPGLSINALPADKRNEICELALSRMKPTLEGQAEPEVKERYRLAMTAVVPYTDNQTYLEGIEYLSKLDKVRNKNHRETFKEVLSIIEA